jgi:hypothetical protein
MTTKHADIIDVEISNHGSVFLFTPLTELANEWLQEHIAEGSLYHGRSLAVDHRYARDLEGALIEAGLNIK